MSEVVDALVGDAPCDFCGLARLCRTQRRACAVFEDYVSRGQFDRDAPRRPLRAIYVRLFGSPATLGSSTHSRVRVVQSLRISQRQQQRGSFRG
jgi:hypothetical protein